MLQFLKGLIRSKLSKRPTLLSHLLTQRCNLNCCYCLWKDNTAKSMTTEEILQVHSDAAKNGFVGIFLWGGEPLIRQDIEKILQHDHSLGWMVSMATNGCFLASKADMVAKYVDELLVSIDIPSQEHDKVRGGKSFDAAVRGIRAVRTINPKCRITICTVLSRYNKDALLDLAKFARDEGCKWNVQHMDHDDQDFSAHDMSQEERNQVLDELIILKKKGYPLINSFTYLRQFRSPRKSFSCRSQYLYLTVWPNGDVISCTSGKHIANVLETPIKSVLKLPGFQKHLLASRRCSSCKDAGTLETTYIYDLKLEPTLNFLRRNNF